MIYKTGDSFPVEEPKPKEVYIYPQHIVSFVVLASVYTF